MNKQEAIKSMSEGKRVRHRNSSSDERMSQLPNGDYLLEDDVLPGVTCTSEEFWKYRTDAKWDDGYELFKS